MLIGRRIKTFFLKRHLKRDAGTVTMVTDGMKMAERVFRMPDLQHALLALICALPCVRTRRARNVKALLKVGSSHLRLDD